jgi:hypothetical protein
MGRTKDLREAVDKYSGSQAGFFHLANDKDSAVVRFLYKGEEDLDWYIVHRVQIGDKKRYVQCTEEQDCPLCVAGNKPKVRLFVQLVDYSDGEQLKVWDRGKTTISNILGLIDKYIDKEPFWKRRFEIERHGKKGDTSTTYMYFPIDVEKMDEELAVEDLPEKQELLAENGFVLKKNIEDMKKIANETYQIQNSGTVTKRAKKDDMEVF